MDKHLVTLKSKVVVEFRKGDYVYIRYPGSGKEGANTLGKRRKEGLIRGFYPNFMLMETEKQYKHCLMYRDLQIGHCVIVEHRRGGKRIDKAYGERSEGKRAPKPLKEEKAEKAADQPGDVERKSIKQYGTGGIYKSCVARRSVYYPGEFSQYERLEALALVKASGIPQAADKGHQAPAGNGKESGVCKGQG